MSEMDELYALREEDEIQVCVMISNRLYVGTKYS